MKIMIAGGSGLIGTKLRMLLTEKGHQVSVLSRNPKPDDGASVFGWSIKEQYVDPEALDGVNVLINLAGAGIADARWSSSRKEILRKSRVEGNRLLLEAVKSSGKRLSLFIGASAIGIYGDRGEEWLSEDSKSGENDFLVSLCKEWEASHQAFADHVDRLAIVRIGVVLSKDEGALERLNRYVILGSSGYMGDGSQYMSWIHIEDLSRIFLEIVESDRIQGTLNATSPQPVTNKVFMQTLVSLRRGLGILLPIPRGVLKVVLGEMSQVLLDSSRVAPGVMDRYGFRFKYKRVDKALKDLIK